jgi:glutamate 5-kinase
MRSGRAAPGVSPADEIAEALAAAKRIVVKVGTSVLLRDDGRISLRSLASLIDSSATLRRAGCDVLLVSSGAVGLGAERLALAARPATVAARQACAAAGQSRLVAVYEEGFAHLGLATAQILLTDGDIADPCRRRRLRDTVDTLFQAGVIPIVNENDTVSAPAAERAGAGGGPASGRLFHDNDMLAALMASTIGASVLLLLSDVDGLYTANPRLDAGATLVPTVRDVTPEIMAAAAGSGTRGRGGMAGKLAAARAATDAGVLTIVANGHRPGIIDDLWAGVAAGTIFLPTARLSECSG